MLCLAAQTSYLLYASDGNQNFKISQLDADYYNVTTQISVLDGTFCLTQGPARRLMRA